MTDRRSKPGAERRDLERRMEAGFDRVDRDARDLRMPMFQPWGSTMVGLLGVIATVLATNT